MKKLYCFIILIWTYNINSAQNLIPNGDFEIYVDCPYWYNDLDTAYAWSNPMTNVPDVSGTPDYFHACANYPVGVPENFQGFQQARSKFAYAGIYLTEGSGANADNREYIQTFLNAPLVAGKCYHFEMYINLSNNCRYTTDDIGVKISSNFLSGINNQEPLLYIPDIINLSSNTFDTLNWTLVSGDYVATGGELYLLIGNFKNDLQTTSILYNNSSPHDYIYCYIDDVSLTRCLTTVSINDQEMNAAISIYPNPAKDVLNIRTNELMKNPLIHIYDVSGKEVRMESFINTMDDVKVSLDISKFCKGLYIISVTTDTQNLVTKFVKD